jgi:hypothetical protein
MELSQRRGWVAFVRCLICRAGGPVVSAQTRQAAESAAVAVWNERASPSNDRLLDSLLEENPALRDNFVLACGDL